MQQSSVSNWRQLDNCLSSLLSLRIKAFTFLLIWRQKNKCVFCLVFRRKYWHLYHDDESSRGRWQSGGGGSRSLSWVPSCVRRWPPRWRTSGCTGSQVLPLTQFYSVDLSQSSCCKKVRFQQTHNQGLHQLLLTVSWDLRAQHGTPDNVFDSL